MILVDSSAWVEILKGTERGMKAKELIKKSTAFYSPLSVAEVSKWCEDNDLDAEGAIAHMIETSDDMLAPSIDALILAGKYNSSVNKKRGGKRRISLIDCIIAATAAENQLKVLTLDTDFHELKCESMII
ncbi:MAG: PIN domain-containing protein [Candidatus Micrarchaeota archaeon]